MIELRMLSWLKQE